MTVLLLALAPISYWVIIWIVSRLRPGHLKAFWPLACAGAALSAGIALQFVLGAATSAAGPNEIAWTGMETGSPDDTLQVGGPRSEAIVGWPNGAFSPELRVAHNGDRAALTILGGAGFVRAADGHFLNGTPLQSGNPLKSGHVLVRYLARSWPWRPTLTLTTAEGAPLAHLLLPRVRKDRVLQLVVQVQPAAADLRKAGRAVDAALLEQWAASLHLLLASSGDARLLDASPATAEITLPAELTVLWRNLSLPVRLRATEDQQRLQLSFAPPLRRSTRLPDAGGSHADWRLAVTAAPLPGDTAFVFPMGAGLSSFRKIFDLPGGRFPRKNQPVEIPIWPYGRQEPEQPQLREVTSEQKIRVEPESGGAFYLFLATIHDLPRPSLIWAAFLLAFATVSGALWIASRTLRVREGVAVGGLCTAVWTVLIFRLILAYRFALDPSRLDPLAVSGMTAALVGLAVLPATILIAARLRRDVTALLSLEERTRGGLLLIGLIAWLFAAGLIESHWAVALWPNAAAFAPSPGLFEIVLLVALGAIIGAYVFFHYLFDPYTFFKSNGAQQERRRDFMLDVKSSFALAFDLFRSISTIVSNAVWRHVGTVANSPEKPLPARDFWRLLGSVLAVEVLVLLAIRVGMVVSASGVKVAQEIGAPLAFCWTPAFIWLGSRHRFPAGVSLRTFHWGRAAALAAASVIGPVFLFPVAIDDPGGIVVTLGIFTSVALLLLMGGAPRRAGWIVLASLTAALLGCGLLYLNLNQILPSISKVGRAAQRVLVFKEDSALRKIAVYFPVAASGGAPSFNAIRNGLQHTWENRAMAHEGGVFPGMGFGNAPTELSDINQDTLQYDSTFSFFVASENGLAGGMLLLVIFAIPAISVISSARWQFDIGHAVAAVIVCDFFFEAVVHAAMNLGALPFTGRSMPLLSVNSNTDLLRWGVLFWIAAQAMQWRASTSEEDIADPLSLLSGVRRPKPASRHIGPEPSWNYGRATVIVGFVLAAALLCTGYQGFNTIQNPEFGGVFDWHDLLATVQGLADANRIYLRPGTRTVEADRRLLQDGGSLLEQEIARFNALTDEEKIDGPAADTGAGFNASLRALRGINDFDACMAEFAKRDVDTVTAQNPPLLQLVEGPENDDGAPRTYRVAANPAFNTGISFHYAKDPSAFPSVTFRDGGRSAFQIRGPGFEFYIPDRPSADADTPRKLLLESMGGRSFRAAGQADADDSRPAQVSLRLESGQLASELRLVGNWVRNDSGLVFQAGKLPASIRAERGAPAQIAPGARTVVHSGDVVTIATSNVAPPLWFEVHQITRGALIGPAWVMGRWRLEFDPSAGLGWAGSYRTALSAEWPRLGRAEATRRFATLSLDRELQAAAAAFVSEQARVHYDEVLQRKARNSAVLPPRAALTILSVPDGEALALAGWPRSSPDAQWRLAEAGEWLPSTAWIDRHAPNSLRNRYSLDRNFDRLVAGSSSKPLWAAAVLAVQPELDRLLHVRGPEGVENQVFGITLGKNPWQVEASQGPNGWADFASYLTFSDNRYQVRLGFLGLADREGNGPAIAREASESQEESMDGREAWGHYPKFPESIEFTERTGTQLKNLEDTPLAQRMHTMFGLGVGSRDIDSRAVSFWTADETDDHPDPAREQPSALLRGVAPETTQLSLNRITHSREFVNLLLGGGSNRWSNVELAAAFSTAVLGRPVLAHGTQTAAVISPSREQFPAIAERLRPGLRGVIFTRGGTANGAFTAAGALEWLRRHPDIAAYGKTGTLRPAPGQRSTSRMLLTLLRKGADGQERGLTLSIVLEQAEKGTAARWMADFVASHGAELERRLQ